MGGLIKLLSRIISGILDSLRITTIQEEFFVLSKSYSYENKNGAGVYVGLKMTWFES